MNSADLRQACPEFFDFVVALARRIGEEGTNWEQPHTHQCAYSGAHALIALLEAEKASAETAKKCKHQWWRGPENEEYCNQCGAPKPQPPKRSAEEILEEFHGLTAGCSCNACRNAHLIPEALRLVRELRQLAEQRERVMRAEADARWKVEEERDEANRRIERALGYLEHRSKPCPNQLRRILNGGER